MAATPAALATLPFCTAKPAVRHGLRHRLRSVGLLALLGAVAFTAATAQTQAPGAPQVLAAPHYGDTLFNFYQDKTFTALTGLMVSQHFGRISPHDGEAEVLRGGMLLGYGLHDEAAAVFAQLIEHSATPAVQNRAWFLLARSRHQRGLAAAAEASLARVVGPLPGALEEERQLLQAQLLMERGDFTGAATVLEALQGDSQGKPNTSAAALYARFNLGVALIKTGDTARGQALLDAVGQTPAPDEEQRSLRDRANLALGLATLARQQPREARVALQRVRLNGPQANKALLGFGWAAAELKDPQLALVPWEELAGRGSAGGADAAVLEARLAVPYALAELHADGSALQGYQQALEGFDQEQQALADSVAAIRAGTLVQSLLADNILPGHTGLGTATGFQTLPQLPHAAHLAPLLATHGFQQAYRNLRDLQFLQGNLQQWQDSLGTYSEMLDNRRSAFEHKLPAVRAHTGAADIQGLAARREALVAELARVQAEGDAAAFADDHQRALLQRIAQSRRTLAAAALPGAANPAATDPAQLSEATERLRRAAGALTWQLTQQMSARSWDAQKALRGTETGLAQARARDAALAQAQQDEPARQARFAQRISALTQQLAALRPSVTLAAAQVQAQLQDIAVAELEQQQQRLAAYAAQARLAMAQLLDRANLARPTAQADSDGPAAQAVGAAGVVR